MGGDAPTSKYYGNSSYAYAKQKKVKTNLMCVCNVDMLVTSICLIFLVLTSILMTKLLKATRAKVENSEAKSAFFKTALEELVGLGVISFVLLLVIDFGPQDDEFGSLLLKFEFAHLWMLVFGFARVLHNMIGYKRLNQFQLVWQKTEKQKELVEKKNLKPRSLCIRRIIGDQEEIVQLKYRIMRHIFMTNNDVSTYNFNFANYLHCASTAELVEHLEHTDNTGWVLLIVVAFGVISVVDPKTSHTTDTVDLIIALLFGFFNFLFSFMLMLSVRAGGDEEISRYFQKKFPEKYKNGVSPSDYYKLLTEQIQTKEKQKVVIHRRSSLIQYKKSISMQQSPINNECDDGEEKKSKNDAKVTTSKHEVEEEKSPFWCGLKPKHLLWCNDLVTLMQCFYLGLFITLNLGESKKEFGYSAILYIGIVLVQQGVMMLWTSPIVINDLTFLESTSRNCLVTKDGLFAEIKEQQAELNVLRIEMSEAIRKKYPGEEVEGAVTKIFSEEKNNELSRQIVKDLVHEKLAVPLEARQAKLLIQSMDDDFSGTIDLKEFINFLKDAREISEDKVITKTETNDEGKVIAKTETNDEGKVIAKTETNNEGKVIPKTETTEGIKSMV